MVKYRCVKADIHGHIYSNSRTYVEEGIQNARKRAMKMIHGDMTDSVLIYLESDYKDRPWVGYTEKVECMSKKDNAYFTRSKKGVSKILKDGSVKRY